MPRENVTLVCPDLLSFPKKLKPGIVCGLWDFPWRVGGTVPDSAIGSGASPPGCEPWHFGKRREALLLIIADNR